MSFIEGLYKENFIEYASYVIKDRAIPHIDDGLKPVQRRILHSLFEVDDGKFHKVANVVGHTMKYHPHGDASIYSALVVLANKDLFIEKQGNYGNIYTGDSAAAARYIECRLTSLAKEVLYNPELTRYEDSYDSRNKEPVTFPSKIPVLLANGTEGIAVGMATKILPHNLTELLQAQIACLKEEPFIVYPDFLTAGQIDVSEYNDGKGKVRCRARLDTKDPKKIVIKEIPYGVSTESLIASMEAAAKKNRIKVSAISDFTAEKVEIEVILSRGVYSKEVVGPLFAFTDCEVSISSNILVIKEGKPTILTATEAVEHNTKRLIEILKGELTLELGHLKDKLHRKTLEQVFIENRIYKEIEKMDTPEKVNKAVHKGLEPYQSKIKREVTDDDVETLLKIPIRRISLYDIQKAQKEMRDIRKRLKEITAHLNDIVGYGISFLEGLLEKYGHLYPRRTEIVSFDKVTAREVATRNLKLRYDKTTGYLGTNVNGDAILDVSQYDRVLVMQKSGKYSVIDIPERTFVEKGMCFCGFVDKDVDFNILYKDKKNYPYIKRCKVEQFILNKEYNFVPEDATLVDFTINSENAIEIKHKPKPRLKVLGQSFLISEYPVRGVKAKGIRLTNKEMKTAKFQRKTNSSQPPL